MTAFLSRTLDRPPGRARAQGAANPADLAARFAALPN